MAPLTGAFAATAGGGLLEEIERRAVRYFREQSDPHTGLVHDRAGADGAVRERIASIAATGFGLSAMCIADLRGYLPRGEALRRTRRTLEYLAHRAPHEHGFFWHFADARTGARVWHAEISSVDTAWLLCGVLHACAHFDVPAVRRAAGRILDRVDWRWMLDGGELLSHGWTPEAGFLPYRWDSYSELLAMYLLALGSRTSPISPACWNAWKRPRRSYGPFRYIDLPTPLFTHQYSHAWFDFRARRDRYADYFRNSQAATLANRLACVAASSAFPWYGESIWGVTSSDTPDGYRYRVVPDGTVAPSAAGGSIVFLPAECKAALSALIDRYGRKVWKRYGFINAFHPGDNWYGEDVIGIDLGVMLLMAENARTGAVWNAVMSTPEAVRGLDAAGFEVV